MNPTMRTGQSPTVGRREAGEPAGTPRLFRFLEAGCAAAFPVAWLALGWQLAPSLVARPMLLPLAGLVGYLAADFISGFFHWLFDTWLSPDTPVVGRAFVRTFREHHLDPTAIVRHDFVETNGSNMLAGNFLVAVGFASLGDEPSRTGALVATSFFVCALFVSLTSQIHKWAHAERVPAPVRWLQNAHILLGKEAHALHHRAPHDRAYCITSGWLNGTLHVTRFFRLLEGAVTAVTGAVPRRHDTGEDTAPALPGEAARDAPPAGYDET